MKKQKKKFNSDKLIIFILLIIIFALLFGCLLSILAPEKKPRLVLNSDDPSIPIEFESDTIKQWEDKLIVETEEKDISKTNANFLGFTDKCFSRTVPYLALSCEDEKCHMRYVMSVNGETVFETLWIEYGSGAKLINMLDYFEPGVYVVDLVAQCYIIDKEEIGSSNVSRFTVTILPD